MRVLLDETLCDVQADTVSAAIAAAASLAEERGRAIVEIMVDGAAWAPEEFDSPRRPANDVAAEVRLTSADRVQLVRETFHHAAEALADAQRLQEQAADSLRGDETVQAMEALGQALEIWAGVQQAVLMGAEMADIDLDAAPASATGATSVMDAIKGLHGTLQTVRGALESADPAALSDMLLYELPHSVRDYRLALNDLNDQLAGRASS